jgi:hypothetical protein
VKDRKYIIKERSKEREEIIPVESNMAEGGDSVRDLSWIGLRGCGSEIWPTVMKVKYDE